jgi:hypothetical protein
MGNIYKYTFYCCLVYHRWDYSHDERDNEIAELKKRLVEEQRKAKEAAAKAETDLKDILTSLQVS